MHNTRANWGWKVQAKTHQKQTQNTQPATKLVELQHFFWHEPGWQTDRLENNVKWVSEERLRGGSSGALSILMSATKAQSSVTKTEVRRIETLLGLDFTGAVWI